MHNLIYPTVTAQACTLHVNFVCGLSLREATSMLADPVQGLVLRILCVQQAAGPNEVSTV